MHSCNCFVCPAQQETYNPDSEAGAGHAGAQVPLAQFCKIKFIDVDIVAFFILYHLSQKYIS